MKILNYLRGYRKAILISLAFVIVFLALRLPGVSLPYHQDEFKLASALEKGGIEMWQYFSYHPPLEGVSLYIDNAIFGLAHLRMLPIIFSLVSCLVLFLVMKDRTDKRSALLTLALFAMCFYSVWSSLMIDVDGAILPFFFILSLWLYDIWEIKEGQGKWKWLALVVVSLLLGLLVKLSFILVVGVLIVDWLWNNREKVNRKHIIYGSSIVGGLIILAALIVLVLRGLYPAFQAGHIFEHAISFFHLSGRNWTQVIVQGMKALYYLSALLLVPILFIDKETFRKTRVFFIYLVLGFIFYFVLFDFSRGALDKYLMFSIIPLAGICGTILGDIFNSRASTTHVSGSNHSGYKRYLGIIIFVGIVTSVFLIGLNFLPHSVVALYPKEEWFGRALHFEWNILSPFNGGSGPLGFYVSFLFIALSFIISLALGIIGFFKKEWRRGIAVILIAIGLVYNGVFIEELFFGKINGNAPQAMREAVSFIVSSKDIPGVLTYNDTGAYELSQAGKYSGRFYATPQAEMVHMKRFADHVAMGGGYFLVVDIPHINQSSFYGTFFSSCQPVFEAQDGKIRAEVYSCKKP